MEKNKDVKKLLQNILKSSFDIKLSNLEKNSDKHFSKLNLTLSTTKYLTNLTLEITNAIKKVFENKENNKKLNKIHKLSRSAKKINSNYSNHRLKEYKTFIHNSSIKIGNKLKSERKNNNKLIQRFKTESNTIFYDHNKMQKNNINIKSINPIKKEIIFSSPCSLKKYINNNLENKNKINKLNTIENPLSKFITSTNKSKNKKGKIFHTRNHNSIDINLTNKTSESSSYYNNNLRNSKYKGNSLDQMSYKKTTSKNKKISLIGKLKRSIDKYEEKNINNNKNKGKIGIKKNNNNLLSNKKKKNIKINNKKEENIIKNFENNWKKEENIINKDPLLINAMNELEFVPKELISINISRDELNMYINKNKDTSFKSNNDKEKNEFGFSIKNLIKIENSIFVEYLPNILVFLTKIDIIKLKNCSKNFHSKIINYFIKKIDIEKISFLEKQNKLNLQENEINQNLITPDLHLNKGTLKAIKLLNEDIFCRLFYEEKTPNKDILLVYKVYFQLINYKEITDKNISDDIFWEQCRNYFQKYKGNISELLINNIQDNKLLFNGDNLYKIYKLTENNEYKFFSGYFSKLCGTTGLFIFYIKDILDYLGFSNEIKFQKNSYYNFFEITKYLDYKMNILNSFS